MKFEFKYLLVIFKQFSSARDFKFFHRRAGRFVFLLCDNLDSWIWFNRPKKIWECKGDWFLRNNFRLVHFCEFFTLKHNENGKKWELHIFCLKFHWNWFKLYSFLKKKHSHFEDLRNMHCTKILMGNRFLRKFLESLDSRTNNLNLSISDLKSFFITLGIIIHTIVNDRTSAGHFESYFSKDFKIF